MNLAIIAMLKKSNVNCNISKEFSHLQRHNAVQQNNESVYI